MEEGKIVKGTTKFSTMRQKLEYINNDRKHNAIQGGDMDHERNKLNKRSMQWKWNAGEDCTES